MTRLTRQHIDRLYIAKRILIGSEGGVSDAGLAKPLGVSRTTAYRYRLYLGAYEIAPGKWSLEPTADDILFAHAVLEHYGRKHGNPHKARPKR